MFQVRLTDQSGGMRLDVMGQRLTHLPVYEDGTGMTRHIVPTSKMCG